ncbi:MAG: hypothetical protein JEZ14_16410 [Marinilabiliaceae bacterium]|nr:hypothetical protein [Marinilabiliaceae bacterium]
MKIKILLGFFLFLLLACQKEEIKNNKASIAKMSFNFGEVSFEGNEGVLKAPENTDLEKLMPTISISEGASVYPPSNAITDFTAPVDYTVTSEDQKNVNYYTVSVVLPIVKFTVFDCTNRSAENPTSELAPNAKISIFKDISSKKELIEEITTDENGVAFLYGYKDWEYYFLTDKKGAVNLIDGYIVNGIFENQAEIDNYPSQNQPSQIGDLKFMDTNGDGMVDAGDKVDHRRIWDIPENGVKQIVIHISKE